MEYAGFWVRLAAYCIDIVIVWIGMLFVNLMLGIVSIVGSGVLRAEVLFQYTVKDIMLYVLQALYFILLTHGTGTTPGKRLLNLRVVNADGSRELNLLDVIYRETIGRFLCSLSIGIGYIMAGVDREKRGLHDMLCDTRVVYGKKVKIFPVYQAPAPGYVPMPPQNGGPMRVGNVPAPPQNGGPIGAGSMPASPQNSSPIGTGNVPAPPQNGSRPIGAGSMPAPPQNSSPIGAGNVPTPPLNGNPAGSENMPAPPKQEIPDSSREQSQKVEKDS